MLLSSCSFPLATKPWHLHAFSELQGTSGWRWRADPLPFKWARKAPQWLAFHSFFWQEHPCFSRSLTENRKPFGCMPAFSMRWRSAKFNFTPWISRDARREFFKNLISIFLIYRRMSKTSSAHEEFWTRYQLWIIFPMLISISYTCASKSMFTVVS